MATTTLTLRADDPHARKHGNMLYDNEGELERYSFEELAEHIDMNIKVVERAEEEDLRVWCDELDEARKEAFVGECGYCAEDITQGEEFFIGYVKTSKKVEAGVVFDHVRDGDGDACAGSLFICFGCWDVLRDGLRELRQNEPEPHDEHEQTPILGCEACGETVRMHEPHLQLWLVESDGRIAPVVDGDEEPRPPEFRFKRISRTPDILCCSCMVRTEEEEWITWEGDISRDGECSNCTGNRCWRNTACDCRCHLERRPRGGALFSPHLAYEAGASPA